MNALHAEAGARSPAPRLRSITVDLLDAVMAIETQAYAFPWSRGNFIDSLAAGYLTRALQQDDGELLGYFVAMPGYEEMHLLNLTVAARHQGRGHARALLAQLYGCARERASAMIWLEVRESNARARALYVRQGFVEAGRRRDYYPAPDGRREDALVMSRLLHGDGR